jgi:hypothetical protein
VTIHSQPHVRPQAQPQQGQTPDPVPAEPTATHLQTAQRIHATHRRVCVPEPVCRWCLKAWPCPGARWAKLVLHRAERREVRPRDRH